MVLLFTVTIFTAAALLFLLQPMFARMILPLLGGAPAVWNAAMVFYQAMLLAGYAYAHWTARWRNARRQMFAHCGLLALALVALPIGVPRGWTPPTQVTPIPWLLAVMMVSVGLPFFALVATSPMLQRWFAASNHRRASDPYFLYAASNLGSLLGLFAYPFFIEPRWRLGQQSDWWSAGFVVLLLLTVGCGLWAGRRTNMGHSLSEEAVEVLPWRRRLRWLLLAFVPCSLMLSVTTFMTNAIAPVPLLWVIPLGIYLLTFVLVFARRRLIPHVWMVRLLPLVALAMPWSMAKLLLGQPVEPLDWNILLHVSGLFLVAMVCHGELAADRPAPSQLTAFYLWLAAGGVLGGIFNAILAPWLFSTVLEYPLTLLLAFALLPQRTVCSRDWRARLGDIIGPVLLGALTLGLVRFLRFHTLVFWLPAALGLLFLRRPIRFALGMAAVMAATLWPLLRESHTLLRARSFFGIHAVVLDPEGGYHHLKHGCTVHGTQSIEPTRRRLPLGYFARTGPLGDIMAQAPDHLKRQVAVVGLGAGTVAAYGEAGQQWTFYEIDPVVERIARDPRYFSYLSDCRANLNVVLGDARLSLQREPDGRFGLMILDPYNSDTPPLHLLTREALALYLRKLAPDGILAFHISTTHLDLKSVLANLARDTGLFALHTIDFASSSTRVPGQAPSRWMVMARQPRTLELLAMTGYWRAPLPQASVGIWTDDHASLFRVWSWGR